MAGSPNVGETVGRFESFCNARRGQLSALTRRADDMPHQIVSGHTETDRASRCEVYADSHALMEPDRVLETDAEGMSRKYRDPHEAEGKSFPIWISFPSWDDVQSVRHKSGDLFPPAQGRKDSERLVDSRACLPSRPYQDAIGPSAVTSSAVAIF